jgi:hypothetical protein
MTTERGNFAESTAYTEIHAMAGMTERRFVIVDRWGFLYTAPVRRQRCGVARESREMPHKISFSGVPPIPRQD